METFAVPEKDVSDLSTWARDYMISHGVCVCACVCVHVYVYARAHALYYYVHYHPKSKLLLNI